MKLHFKLEFDYEVNLSMYSHQDLTPEEIIEIEEQNLMSDPGYLIDLVSDGIENLKSEVLLQFEPLTKDISSDARTYKDPFRSLLLGRNK